MDILAHATMGAEELFTNKEAPEYPEKQPAASDYIMGTANEEVVGESNYQCAINIKKYDEPGSSVSDHKACGNASQPAYDDYSLPDVHNPEGGTITPTVDPGDSFGLEVPIVELKEDTEDSRAKLAKAIMIETNDQINFKHSDAKLRADAVTEEIIVTQVDNAVISK